MNRFWGRPKETMISRLGTTCVYCRTKLRRADVTVDHLVPLARGGPDVVENMVPACARCNRLKRDMMPLEFIMWRITHELRGGRRRPETRRRPALAR